MTRIFKPNELKLFNLFRKGMVLLLLSLLITGIAYSQEKTVTGTIVDKSGSSLPGASVVIKGTDKGVISDLDGKFSITVPSKDAILLITFVGYLKEEVVVGEQTNIRVVLLEDIMEMSEVVVIGYGTIKKSDLTGAVASISSEDLKAIPSARVDEALTGRAAGVNVTATSGMPGASRVIQIRGISSINGANPLIVIDGIPGGDMNLLSPSEIESVEVLKDAASTAIYGASGGNGVILITTKKGKIGKPVTSINVYTGVQQLGNKIEMMDTREWNKMYASITGRPFIYSEDSLNMNIDWQDEVYEAAPMSSVDFNTAGGNEQVRYSFSSNYLTQKGMVRNTGYDKFSIGLNSQFSLTKRIKFDEVIRFSHDKTTGPSEWQYQNMYNNFTTMPTLLMHPFVQPYDEDGVWSVSPVSAMNPMVGIDMRSNMYNKNIGVHGNFGLVVDLVKGLNFTSRISGTVNNRESWSFMPEYFSWAEDQNPIDELRQNWTKAYSWTFQNYLTYNLTLAEKHNFNAILGMEASNWWDYFIGGFRQDYSSTNPDLLYFNNSNDNSTPAQIIGGSGKEASGARYFGRVNYDFNNLFLAQFNASRDGNSNFGPNYKWGNFYSGSVGFKFSELEVIKNLNLFSFGKIRIGYGESGQFPITSYWPYASSILNTPQMNYAFDNATITTGLGPVQIPNPDLRWETVKTTNFGADLSFLQNQLKVTLDYFIKENEDMIMPQETPSLAGTYTITGNNAGELGSTGITSTYPLVNYGSVSNKGLETTIDYTKLFGELKVNIGANFTYQVNEITELAIDSTINGISIHDVSGVTINKIGQPIGTYRGYEFDGLFREGDRMVYNSVARGMVFADQPYIINATTGDTTYARPRAKAGDAKWVDRNNDGRWDANDYNYLGTYIPKFVYGFNLGLNYKGVDFSMFWQGVAGNKIFNGVKRNLYDWQTPTNHAKEFADRYHLPIVYNGVTIDEGNLESNMPEKGAASWAVPSTLYIEDGAYLRLRSLTIGYTLPNNLTSKIGISKLRFYYTGKNLITFTKYMGYDPEINSFDPKIAGVDITGYPQAKMNTIGINLEF